MKELLTLIFLVASTLAHASEDPRFTYLIAKSSFDNSVDATIHGVEGKWRVIGYAGTNGQNSVSEFGSLATQNHKEDLSFENEKDGGIDYLGNRIVIPERVTLLNFRVAKKSLQDSVKFEGGSAVFSHPVCLEYTSGWSGRNPGPADLSTGTTCFKTYISFTCRIIQSTNDLICLRKTHFDERDSVGYHSYGRTKAVNMLKESEGISEYYLMKKSKF